MYYLIHFAKRVHVYSLIGFILSCIFFVQAIEADEIESSYPGEKISRLVKFMESIPEYSKSLYIGPLRINPSLQISETYDDNVLGASSNPVHDYYATYKPKISLSLPIRDHKIAFDYGYTIFEYEGFSARVPEQDHVNRKFGGSMNLNFANGFSISLSDRVAVTRRPAGGVTRRTNQRVQFPGDEPLDEPEDPDSIEEQFGINTVRRARREATNNTASIRIDLPNFFSKLDFSLFYSNFDVSYKGHSFDNAERNTDSFGGTATIKPLPKINVTTGFRYSIIRYDSALGSDSRYQSIPFSIEWQATGKSKFFLNSSYNYRNYKNGSIFKKFSGYIASFGYRFNVTPKDNLTIKIERSLKEQQFQSRIKSVTETSETVPDTNPYYFTQLDIDWVHRFSSRFSIILSPTINHLRFREKVIRVVNSEQDTLIKHEKVDTIRFEIKGRYDAPRGWLFGQVSYQQQDRDSNLPGGDMIKNVIRIGMGLNF